jgi:predicted permease
MWARRLVNKLRFLCRLGRFDRDLAEEMAFHREMLELEKAGEGLPPDAAAVAARRQLGNTLLARERSRDVWIVAWLDGLLADLRYGLRTIAGNKPFASLAVVTLGLGIGANTAIYSFMDAILLRSLPVADPGSLVVLGWRARAMGHGSDSVMKGMSGTTWEEPSGVTGNIVPFPAYELFRSYDSLFSVVFARYPSWEAKRLNVAVRGEAGIAGGEFVSGDFFRGLGVRPAAGRLIDPDDDRPGGPAVVVVSHALSQRRFGGPSHAAGQPVLIDNLPFTVVGVTPPGFFGIDPAVAPDVYLPMHTNEVLGASHQFGFRPEDYLACNYYWVEVMGRLRPDVSRERAQAVLAPAFRRWVAGTAASEAQRANLPALVVDRGGGGLDKLRRQYSQPLFVLLALTGSILVLACANVANLLLARGAARGRELALRASVGAGRLRIVRQLLTESVLLASLGGALGVLLAVWGIRLLTLLLANGRADFTLHAELDWRVLGVAAALSVLTGILFGLAPALHATRVDAMSALKTARAGQPQRGRGVLRLGVSHLLTVSQIAISLVMLVAAGLFVRTLSNLQSVSLGFERENVLLFEVDARKAGHRDPEITSFYRDLRRRFAALPGVRSASLTKESLIRAGSGLPISLPGSPPDPATRYMTVGPGFFGTMGIPMLEGRDFEDHDGPGSPAVAVVNEVFAGANFGDRSPLGRHVVLWEPGKAGRVARDMEVVGVSRNARYGGLKTAIPPVVYMPYDQGYPQLNAMVYALRTAGDPLRYVSHVREIVRAADPRVPISEVRSQAADVDRTINQELTFAELCSGFAVLALVIASVGLYGTVSYGVSRRTGEIGIRMALGAQRGRVVRMILLELLAPVTWGLAIGLATALAASKLIASFLYGTKANDPLALTAAVATLLTAALVAAYVPARRASRIEPVVALRQE